MKKVLLSSLVFVISIVFAATVSAQAPAQTPEKKVAAEKAVTKEAATPAADVKAPAPKKERTRARGEVVSVDAATKTLVVKGKKGEMTFDIANVKFAKGLKTEDLKAGDKVMVGYKEVDGKMVAKFIGKHNKHDIAGLTARGKVVSTDTGAKIIVVAVKGKKGEMTFDVANAKFGKDLKLEDLKAGDRITVGYEETDGKMVAKFIGKPRHHGKKHHKKDTKEKKPVEAAPATPAK